MDRHVRDKVDGWDISLQRNVHMYTHALSIKNGHSKFGISCEDLPSKEKVIGIWLHTSSIPQERLCEVKDILLKWAKLYPLKFQIYTREREFVSNQ